MTKSKVVENLLKAKKVAIFGHVNPDPDAYGSMFGAREFLREQGKVAEVFAVKNEKCFLDEIFPLQDVKTDFSAKDFDLVLCVDMHAMQRIASIFQEEVKKAKKIVVIDHHEVSGKEEMICKDIFTLPEKAATCEIITDLLTENKLKISPKTATYLWAGLIGDTGRFLHNNLSENVLKVAQILKSAGADDQFVYDKMFRSKTMKQLQLQKNFINRIVLLENGQAGYALFTLKDMKKLGATLEDVKTYTNMITGIDGVKLSFLITERDKNHFKFSIRTNGVDCSKFASNMGGGGHKCASGFDLICSAREIKKKIPVWAREILSEGN